MTYASIFDAYGWERLEADARAAGATSFIVPDLPGRRAPRAASRAARRPDVDRRAAAPRGRRERRLALPRHRHGHDGRARRSRSDARSAGCRGHAPSTTLPLYAGFGISTPAQARAAADLTDGVVVGSRAVEAAEQGPAELARFVSSLRAALDA